MQEVMNVFPKIKNPGGYAPSTKKKPRIIRTMRGSCVCSDNHTRTTVGSDIPSSASSPISLKRIRLPQD